jgi:8-oxo-dGTP diphosphatase
MPTTPQSPVIAVGILINDGKVLLCHRSPSRECYPNVWDFPGGHVEVNETPAFGLVRELGEELGILIDPPERPCWARISAGEFDLRFWLVTEWVGTPTNVEVSEHDEIGWFSESNALDLRLAHAAYPALISTALRLAEGTRHSR